MVTGAYRCGSDLFINSASQLLTTGIRFSEENTGHCNSPTATAATSSVMRLELGVIPLAADLAYICLSVPARCAETSFWDAMQDNMLGEIILVDSAHPETMHREARAIRRYLREHQPILDRSDKAPASWKHDLGEMWTALRLEPEESLWACEVTDSTSAKTLLVQFLKTLAKTDWVEAALMRIASRDKG
ncbi:MAG: hypothetical protein U0694_24240 [Anaerolineae bacterium]